MFEIYEHNKSDCIKLLNMIICEIPFIKSFSDECLLERLLNLISIITNSFDNPNDESLDSNVFDSEEERETAIREWLLRHYSAKFFIDDLNFNDSEDRARVTVLIINIIFKLRHSLKDIEQYLKDCDSFVQFDRQLTDITRFDRLLEIVENDCNRWKSEARHLKVKYAESKKLIDKYQQNEIFNYNCNPRNQNLYKSRMSSSKGSEEPHDMSVDQTNRVQFKQMSNPFQETSLLFPEEAINGFVNQTEGQTNNMDVNYLCIECDKSYSTKYEYNLHVLKDHKHFDISQIVSNHNITEKKSTNVKKRVFRCNYNNCKKAFHKSYELKKHFVRHQPKIDRLLYVYNDYTNAVLNNLRAHSLKAIRLSNCEHKPKKINKSIKNDYKIDMNLNVNNYEFNGFCGIDSHPNNSNDVQSVPFCQTDHHINDSFDFMNKSTNESTHNGHQNGHTNGHMSPHTAHSTDTTKMGLFQHLSDNLNLKTYSKRKSSDERMS